MQSNRPWAQKPCDENVEAAEKSIGREAFAARPICKAGACRALLFSRVARRIGGLADFLLRLARILFNIAGHFLCLIAGDLANHFFHSTLDLVLGTFGTILVHVCTPVRNLRCAGQYVLGAVSWRVRDIAVRIVLTHPFRSDVRQKDAPRAYAMQAYIAGGQRLHHVPAPYLIGY